MKASLYLVAAVLAAPVPLARADCLDDVTAFADKLCAGARTIGKSNLVDGDGELNAAAKGLITKAVAELGNGASTANAPYEKVLQEQLGAERISMRKCGIAMAKTALDEICFKDH